MTDHRSEGLPLPTSQVILLSVGIAFIIGFMGSLGGVYLYDRGMSKGNDLAVQLIGFHAIGTLIFVIVFSWLRHVGREISGRTPALALLFCMSIAAMTTAFFRDDIDGYYMSFAHIGWILILLCGLIALLVSHYFFIRKA
jgi:hypothetical protein